MKKILLILLVPTIFLVHGQTNSGGLIQNSVNSIAPKSPDAAALFRYTETPVSLYTGVPDITIPIYTIKEGDIEVPISISYHAGGIKVTDEASSVGLGWSLNAGGRTSHIMSGVNDFSLHGYYRIYPKSAYPQFGGITGCPQLPWNMSTYNGAFYSDWFSKIESPQITSITYEGSDFQPDLFLINLPNKSYKAYLDMANTIKPNGEVKFLISGQENIKFKLIGAPGPTGNYNFQVIDENGINYYFDKAEITTRQAGWNTISGLSRVLSKIEDTKGNVVNFSTSSHITNARLAGCKNTRVDFYYPPGQNQNLGFPKENGMTDCSKQLVDESYLETIEFTNGSITFSWTSREDINNSKKLSSIKIYNNYKLIKQYDFDYDYFISTDNLNTGQLATWLGSSTNNIFTHRLKLLGVKEIITNQNYNFYYNSTYNLPNKLSFSSDFWGYYNGQNNGDTFIPDPSKYIKGENVFNITSFVNDETGYWYNETYAPPTFNPNNGGSQIYKDFSTNGKHYLSDRRASLYSLAGMLTAINYPTGGKTEYEYEPNTFSNFPLQSLINDNTRKEASTNHIINNINGSPVHTANPTEFSVVGNNIKINIFANFGFNYVATASNDAKNSFWLYIKNKSTGQIVKKIYNSNIGTYQTTLINDNIILQSGIYELGMSYDNNFFWGNVMSGGVNTFHNTGRIVYVNEKSVINGLEYNYSSGGGVRIKSIKTTEKIGAIPITKNYIYNELSDNGMKINSNGNLAVLPKFFEIENRCYNYRISSSPTSSFLSNPDCFMNLGANNYPFKISVYEGMPNPGTSTLPQGNHVGYSKVTEEIIGKGKTESFFKNDYSQSCLMMPAKGTSLLIGDGDMLKQRFYNNNNELAKEIEYNYKNNNPDLSNPHNLSGTILEPLSNFINGVGVWNDGVAQIYNSFGGLIHNYSINLWKTLLESTTTKEYFPAGSSNFLETKSFTTYNNKYQPKIQKTIYPDLSFSEITYNYAHEKGNQLLIEKNMVGIPLETIITRTANGVSKTVSKTENVYPTSLPDSQIGNFVLPKSVKSLDISNSTNNFTEITLDKYDTKGNLIQYTAKDGNPISIVWGYNYTLPIAKIEGAFYDNIAPFISDIITKSNEDALDPTKEQMLLDAEDNLRRNSNFSSYQISTYTHDPLIGVTSVTPSSGLREYYKYDTTNRLEKIVDINNKILKEFNYNYSGTSSMIFQNDEKSKVFTRTNCPTASSVPGSYNYIVPAVTYFSTISLLDANQKALDDINMNGQNIANQNGSCIPIVSCPFTFSTLTNNAPFKYNNTTTANNSISFNVSFSPYGIWQSWANGLNIGTIEGDCKPTSNKEIIYTETIAGRQWRVFIDTAGSCTLRLLSGTVDASSNNPINLQFLYQK